MGNQDGKITSTNAPPFATADGKPTTTSSAAPNNFVKNAKSDATKGGEFDATRQNRQQPTETAQPSPPPWLTNRPQQAGGPMSRVNPRSVPDSGLVPPTPTKQPSKGTGTPGVGRVPFKVPR